MHFSTILNRSQPNFLPSNKPFVDPHTHKSPKMPKSKRTKVYHLTQVNKKTREQKEKLFQDIRDTVPKYERCFVLGFDNMRNNHLKDVRHELSDSRYG